MNNFKFIISIFGACAMLAGCSGDNTKDGPDVPDPPKPEKLEIRISPSVGNTKATDSGFDKDDRIGLYVVNYKDNTPGTLLNSGNHVDNMRFTYSGTWEPDSKVYWLDQDTHADVYLYYPYATVSTVSALPFTVKADQSVEQNYKASDFMVGKTENVAPSTSAVSIVARHVMSRMSVVIKAGNGFTSESLASASVSVKVNNLKTSATVNISEAKVTATGEGTTMTPYLSGGTYRMIVVPQTVAEGDLFVVTVDGREFKFKRAMTFESGKNHDFTLTLSKTSTGINVSIGNWENAGEDFGGTAE